MRNRSLLGLTLCLLMAPGVVAQADVTLPSVFGSGMVLQRDMPVPVWGWADPDESVEVSFRDQTATATADENGKWQLSLDALEVGEPATLTVKGNNEVTLDDVLVGEVWVCSGQSNMQWSVGGAIDSDLETLSATNSQIRLFQVPMVTATEPQSNVDAHWQTCSPESIPNFTAVGYFFGRQLQETLGVPVGLIQTAWGGTPAESWASHESLAANPDFAPILDTWKERIDAYDPEKAKQDYEEAMTKWKADAEAARAAGKRPPGRPNLAQDPVKNPHNPSVLYNAMVAPLVPYAIRGAIWYQGESNAGRAYQYRSLMPAMIQSWRDAWQQGDFPFYQVQLANFMEPQKEPQPSAWAELREAQMIATKTLPNVGAACIIDLGAAKDIHPKDKQNVGKRLARMALHDVYGYDDLVRQGPTFESLKIEGDHALVKFDTRGVPLVTYYNEPLLGFAIAGDDGQWKWGEARIVSQDTVAVSSPDVPHPVNVRYNWADNPQGTLYNAQYLPAYPFRTDEEAGVTVKNVRP